MLTAYYVVFCVDHSVGDIHSVCLVCHRAGSIALQVITYSCLSVVYEQLKYIPPSRPQSSVAPAAIIMIIGGKKPLEQTPGSAVSQMVYAAL